jgi:hypothetical protein
MSGPKPTRATPFVLQAILATLGIFSSMLRSKWVQERVTVEVLSRGVLRYFRM